MDESATEARFSDGASVREHLVRAVHADLIGPYDDTRPDALEELPLAPSRWYLTGFLAPEGAPSDDDPPDDEMDAGNDEDDEDSASEKPEPKPKKRAPASLGLSVLLPPGSVSDTIEVTVSYADYEYVPAERGDKDDERKKSCWKRRTPTRIVMTLTLDPERLAAGERLQGGGIDSRGIYLVGQLKETSAHGLDRVRALSLFVVNRRPPETMPARRDEQTIFQVEMAIGFAGGFEARPNRADEHSSDWDARVADIQFRDRAEYVVGHGVAATVDPTVEARVVGVRTCWIPRAIVPRVVTHEPEGVTTGMDDLASLGDANATRSALVPLIKKYAKWIDIQAATQFATKERKETRDALVFKATHAKERIAEGIELLATDADVLIAFRLANRAMALQGRRRNPRYEENSEQPRWRLFQLAFVLMNLPSVAVDGHRDRDTVELIFFPTGGGKTEAYLGLIAFTVMLRRLRGHARPDRGLGVAVLLRYTLRLLTLDQLSRAATLMCALERIRLGGADTRLGDERFAIGLWVGRAATANTLDQVKEKITEYKNSTSPNAPSPFPLADCPWCGKPLKKESLALMPNRSKPREVVVGCADFACDFSPGKNRDGLPILFVDEPIYRELPCFLIATVDKFAMLPWRGDTGALFGRVQARVGREFFGPVNGVPPKTSEPLPNGLLPPELIVQDELHLISGPLGTMVGLYETAIDELTTGAGADGKPRRAKIIASTATVRRAREQIRALFVREHAVFPPPGVNDGDNFFARTDVQTTGRLYVGVAAPGRALKAILLRTYVCLLGAAERAYRPAPAARGSKPTLNAAADPYMTIAGYFNSLRELGGMRRLVEDEVVSRCSQNARRKPQNIEAAHVWFANRDIGSHPVELTSRESTFRIAEAKSRLEKPFTSQSPVDVLLASNMISVGVDIERLGLMVVAGQPKSTSEYIQASSRVGRAADKPGLVVTVFNLHKPRDRSHYERFAAYHASFYRFVEATSLTPFSGPALDRGLAGVLVALIRLLDPTMTPAEAVIAIESHAVVSKKAIEAIAARGSAQVKGDKASQELAANLTDRCKSILDSWKNIARRAREGTGERRYSTLDRGAPGKPLLFTTLDEDVPPVGSDDAKFAASMSMRDVEPSVHLWLQRGMLGGKVSTRGD
jgi:hypothetical protein